MLSDEEVMDLWNEHMVWGDPKRGGFADFLSAVRAAVAAERERCAAVARRLGETHEAHVTVNARNAADKIARAIEGPSDRAKLRPAAREE